MTDTHCHIYLDHFKDDLPEVLDRAAEAGVKRIIMPSIDYNSLEAMNRLSHKNITFFKMAGVHPCEINNSRCNLEASLLAYSSAKDIVAVGETGLDYYWSTDFIKEQQVSLKLHCKVAKTLNKPIVLHNRDATADLLNIIEEQQDGRLRGVWHCFNGTVDEGLRAIDLGLYLGIGGVVTFKNSGVDKTVKQLPLNKMLLETDAPYLTPAPHRGKRNEPSYVRLVAEKMAAIFDTDISDISKTTSENASVLFSLN